MFQTDKFCTRYVTDRYVMSVHRKIISKYGYLPCEAAVKEMV
jgi:hypothetical protein